MTGGAGGSQLLLVRIGLAMAAGASGLQFNLFGVFFVARFAGYFLMAAAQWKFGILVVIKVHVLPGNLAMTVAATGTVRPLVHVIGLVAIDAAAGQLRAFHDRRMAERASKRAMAAAQGKIGCCMIEFDCLPSGGHVALIAFAAKDAMMDIA